MANSAFVNERITGILEHLKEHRSASVETLAKMFYVSEASIRRDLKEMQKMGMIERSRGGALYYENADEVSIFVRAEKNAKEKEQTATIALKALPDFQSVFIDNSSTCLALAERMNLAYKTVVTNGLQIASKLSQKENVTIIMPGGEFHYNTNSVTGSITCDALDRYRVDLMLSSCAAIDDGGTFEHSPETMQLKRRAFERSRIRYLLVDSSKFGQSATYCTRKLSDYDGVITNADDKTANVLKQWGANVINK